MQQLRLVDARFHSGLHLRLAQIGSRESAQVEFGPIFAPGTPACIRAVIRGVQGDIVAQLGNQMQVTGAHHLHTRTIAKMPIQDHVDQRDEASDQLQLSLEHALDALQLGRQARRGFSLVAAALGPSRLARGRGREAIFGAAVSLTDGFLLWSAHDLFGAQRKGAAGFRTKQGQAEKGEAGHRFLIEAREEAVQAVRFLAGFGHDHLIPGQQIDIIFSEEMLAKEEPGDRGPGNGGGKEALHGTIAAAAVGPAGDTQHGDAPGHGQQGQGNDAQLAGGGGGERWHQAGQEW